MRLDSFLVKKGLLSSRGRAKRAIEGGYVKVNRQIMRKPSCDVSYSDLVEVMEELDKPSGYWKLKDIQEKTGLLRKGDIVLDIGSSVGGFLLYASEIAARVHGVEFSREFKGELDNMVRKRPNITVEFGDVYKIQVDKLGLVDVILNDLTVKPKDSLKALDRILPALKVGGRVLQVVKLPRKMELNEVLEGLRRLNLEILDVVEGEKKEVFIMGRKK